MTKIKLMVEGGKASTTPAMAATTKAVAATPIATFLCNEYPACVCNDICIFQTFYKKQFTRTMFLIQGANKLTTS